MTTEPGLTEKYLGRSLRPWWGESPARMIARGVLQSAALGVAAYVGVLLYSDGIDLAEVDAVSTGTVEKIGLVMVLVAAVGVLYNLIRLAVAVADLFTVHTVEGTLLSCTERRRGDFLPGFVQDMIWSGGTDGSGYQKYDRRRIRTMLVVQTPSGVRTWTLSRAMGVDGGSGKTVRVRVSQLLGHVSRID